MASRFSNSPRQKMINLMYLVFIAMLALNVSVEVLNGFDIVESSLSNSSNNIHNRNNLIMAELEQYNAQNREKAGEWYDKGVELKQKSDFIIHHIDSLKESMVRVADGKKADINNIKNRENIDAASIVMLSSNTNEGQNLREMIVGYKDYLIGEVVADENRQNIIANSLDLSNSNYDDDAGKDWEHSMFYNMPVSAAVTILTKLQNDIRLTEGEALNSLLNNVDVGDFRVNRLNAYVIPDSRVVIQGARYNARIVLSAEDSTQTQTVYVNGKSLGEGTHNTYSVSDSRVGTFPVDGYVELKSRDGNVLRRSFSDSYTVIEPMATIAPTLMNVLYAGIENEISVSVPGIMPQDVTATMTNGTLTRKGSVWVATPSRVGQDVEISISARTGAQTVNMASQKFKVRALPDPTPYIEYNDANGNPVMFKGGGLSKAILMNADGIKAAIDDGILNIPFRVNSFRTIFFDSMGNAIPEVSDGSRFSSRQKEQIRRLQRGSYFYISGVKAAGPDGSEREIAVIEVRIG